MTQATAEKKLNPEKPGSTKWQPETPGLPHPTLSQSLSVELKAYCRIIISGTSQMQSLTQN